MQTKDKVWSCVVIILALVIIFTNIEFKDYPTMKEREETFEGKCEIWKVCDNIPDIWSPMVPTPEDYTYQCWQEERNCQS